MANGKAGSYSAIQANRAELRLLQMEEELPPLVIQYLKHLKGAKQPLTVLSYAYDIKYFLEYLIEREPAFSGKETCEFTGDDFAAITLPQFDSFKEYELRHLNENVNIKKLTVSDLRNDTFINKSRARVSHLLTSVRQFYKYMFDHEVIPKNVASCISMPKIKEKNVIYLDPEQASRFLDVVYTGNGFSHKQQAFAERTRVRDIAIITLFLGTGMRESELVGLDTDDVDLENRKVVVLRKGGNQATLFFNEDVANALSDWLEFRKTIDILPEHRKALFISGQQRRISARAVQELVKKFARATGNESIAKISVHKLRASFATNLYSATGDIFVVSNSLGHKKIETAKKYVTAKDSSREAAESITITRR